ncbi:histone chaperone rtt106-like [Phragmites australis]|uniref:histone chaperone rtt106-like n=1 Tax=Phragmites australis TaxID=29695 RepID=UPI002D766DBA|nr:histone chaperone rtt106-like [Phragmites australis]
MPQSQKSNHPSLPPEGWMTEIQYLDRTASAVRASLGSAALNTNRSPSQCRKSFGQITVGAQAPNHQSSNHRGKRGETENCPPSVDDMWDYFLNEPKVKRPWPSSNVEEEEEDKDEDDGSDGEDDNDDEEEDGGNDKDEDGDNDYYFFVVVANR